MADIATTYMGIRLSSPVIVGASTFSRRIDNIKKAEDAGAGALVIYSLFQEQIQLEARELENALNVGSESFAEALSYFPHLEHAGPREHVMWTEKTRKEVRFPLIGSINATSKGDWVDYARQLESAGCDAIELNLYAVQTDPRATCADIEEQSLEVITSVAGSVQVPVAVKLSPFYTALANFAGRAVKAGADGLVLFNRFYQPQIDPDRESLVTKIDLSTPEETRLPLRWVAILSGEIEADLASNTGIHTGKDVVRHLLAGARAVQSVSALYKNGLNHITTMNREVSEWMDAKGYKSIDDFRGKLNQKNVSDPYAFERAQYIKLLLGHD
jgi:dihydroorotate dehydrogenase (fumarate)